MPALFNQKNDQDLIIGHGDFQYKVETNWGTLDAGRYPVKDCHEMVIDRKGRLYLLTNHQQNNVLVYNQNGRLLDSRTHNLPGAHGLTLKNEGGQEFLYLTDTDLGLIIKTDLKGRELLRIENPQLKNKDGNPRPFSPTETAVAENGDIYVADGYGSQYVYVYDQQGQLKNEFGGPGPEEDRFFNAHGITLDERGEGAPKLLVTARKKNQLKYFDLAGNYLSTIELPGAYVCRPVIQGQEVYLATIWSGPETTENSGFVSILDGNNRMVSAPGGVPPIYDDNDRLNLVSQALKVFKHPHDVCIDQDKNLYVPQWDAGNVYPIKLHRV